MIFCFDTCHLPKKGLRPVTTFSGVEGGTPAQCLAGHNAMADRCRRWVVNLAFL